MIFSHLKQKLPKVNKLLAEKLRDEEQGIVSTNKKKKKVDYFNRLILTYLMLTNLTYLMLINLT